MERGRERIGLTERKTFAVDEPKRVWKGLNCEDMSNFFCGLLTSRGGKLSVFFLFWVVVEVKFGGFSGRF